MCRTNTSSANKKTPATKAPAMKRPATESRPAKRTQTKDQDDLLVLASASASDIEDRRSKEFFRELEIARSAERAFAEKLDEVLRYQAARDLELARQQAETAKEFQTILIAQHLEMQQIRDEITQTKAKLDEETERSRIQREEQESRALVDRAIAEAHAELARLEREKRARSEEAHRVTAPLDPVFGGMMDEGNGVVQKVAEESSNKETEGSRATLEVKRYPKPKVDEEKKKRSKKPVFPSVVLPDNTPYMSIGTELTSRGANKETVHDREAKAVLSRLRGLRVRISLDFPLFDVKSDTYGGRKKRAKLRQAANKYRPILEFIETSGKDSVVFPSPMHAFAALMLAKNTQAIKTLLKYDSFDKSDGVTAEWSLTKKKEFKRTHAIGAIAVELCKKKKYFLDPSHYKPSQVIQAMAAIYVQAMTFQEQGSDAISESAVEFSELLHSTGDTFLFEHGLTGKKRKECESRWGASYKSVNGKVEFTGYNITGRALMIVREASHIPTRQKRDGPKE